MNRRYRIVAPTLGMASFIESDFALLRERHEVREVPVATVAGQVRALLALASADLVLLWFGSTRFLPVALAARLMGRPVVIITGGYDVVSEPGIAYGNMRGGLPRLLGRAVFRTAAAVACISEAIRHDVVTLARVPERQAHLIPLGFPAGPEPLKRREPIVLTVAFGDESSIHRKGLMDVARASRLLPDLRFVMVGRFTDPARRLVVEAGGSNLELPGYVSNDRLAELMQSAAVYYQPSLHEGFGCSVAEAMLAGCVPVVTRRGSLPEVVGDAGLYVEPRDVSGQAVAVRAALDRAGSEHPRRRILAHFPVDRRCHRLLQLLDYAMEGQ
ncbi:MAG: glycosyltransferase [Gemmatimonadales bacterium]